MNTKCDVLVLEDDQALLRDLVDFLDLNAICAVGAASGREFQAAFSAHAPKILVVDLVLPDDSGIELIKRVRDAGYTGKIVILSALNSDDQKVEGYDIGADVYLTKNSSLKVIAACVKRLLSAQGGASGAEAVPWRLDAVKRCLIAQDDAIVKLTHKEISVLSVLIDNIGEGVPRATLIGAPNGITPAGERRIDAVISRLRRKVHDATGHTLPIDQVYGVGYVFSDRAEIQN